MAIAFFLTVSLVSDPKGRRWVHFVNRKGKPALGADHPDVASTYNNLGNACCSKGDYDAASEYHEKALAIRLRTLGADQGGGFWWCLGMREGGALLPEIGSL